MAMRAGEKSPSSAMGPIRVWMLGVMRKGTGSGLWKKGLPDTRAGMSSEPQTLPVAREIDSLWGKRADMCMM